MFVGGIPLDAGDKELADHFSKCGEIEYARIDLNTKTFKSKVYFIREHIISRSSRFSSHYNEPLSFSSAYDYFSLHPITLLSHLRVSTFLFFYLFILIFLISPLLRLHLSPAVLRASAVTSRLSSPL